MDRLLGTVPLFHREFGEPGAPSLVILHGLLGSSRNWLSVARALSDRLHVVTLDLRNHGQSPHTDAHGLDLMVADVLRWLDEHHPDAVHLLGHSMGGKVAMCIACREPARASSLIVVDVAPKDYASGSAELRAMQRLEPERLSSRREGEAQLAGAVPDSPTRQFLASNLVRAESGGFRWQVNVLALARALADVRRAPLGDEERFEGRTKFILGGDSAFVADDDVPRIEHHFPWAEIERIPGSGHNPHIDQRDRFVDAVRRFVTDDA